MDGRLKKLARTFLVRILQQGPIPQHVAFIMDGNRRYAKNHSQDTREGHSAGFETLSTILEFSYSLGVKEVTVFAFSVENFKRPQSEVDALMEIAHMRLESIVSRGDIAEQYGIKVNIVGRLELLPERVQRTARRAMDLTVANDKVVLNVCMPYTSRQDISGALRSLAISAVLGDIEPDDVSEELINLQLLRRPSLPLDILVRTSGMKRLSDFMLWEIDGQGQRTFLEFTDCLWPAYTCLQFFGTVLRWSTKVSSDSNELM